MDLATLTLFLPACFATFMKLFQKHFSVTPLICY